MYVLVNLTSKHFHFIVIVKQEGSQTIQILTYELQHLQSHISQ